MGTRPSLGETVYLIAHYGDEAVQIGPSDDRELNI